MEIEIKLLLRNLINSVVLIQSQIDLQYIEQQQDLINVTKSMFARINAYFLEKHNLQITELSKLVSLEQFRISEMIININEPKIMINDENSLKRFWSILKKKRMLENANFAQVKLTLNDEITGTFLINGNEEARLSILKN